MDKKGLIWLTGVCFLLAGGLTFKFLKGEVDTERDSPEPLVVKNYLKAPKPSGTLTVTISRRDSTLGRLVDMNDRGDLLFLTSPRGAKIREFVRELQGQIVERRRIEKNIGLFLGPDGLLIPTSVEPIGESNVPEEFPYCSDLDRPKAGLDSLLISVRRKHNEKSGKDHYGLDQDSEAKISAETVNSKLQSEWLKSVKNVSSTTQLQGTSWVGANPPSLELENADNVKEGSSAIVPGLSYELYKSNAPLTLLELSNESKIWVREHNGNNSNGTDKLIRIDPNSSEEIKLPTGYKEVMRVANTGVNLIATFGKIGGDKPIRAHLRVGEGWRELPIPEGYDFSFVQKVMTNGAMIGYVTTTDGKNIRQVAWLGDACVILNDLPNWPKQGLMSVIILANRQGDIYVRNVLNTETNASEYYLLNVSIKP